VPAGTLALVPVLLFLAFLVVPLVELYVLLQVGSAIGALNTVVLVVLVGVAGAWLVKREGLGVVRRVRSQVAAGQVPGRELVDGFLILFGGALMLTPGFVTDLAGLALLLPPIRAAARRTLAHRLRVYVVGRGGGHSLGF
jgi:UPF0716 protein FxsA